MQAMQATHTQIRNTNYTPSTHTKKKGPDTTNGRTRGRPEGSQPPLGQLYEDTRTLYASSHAVGVRSRLARMHRMTACTLARLHSQFGAIEEPVTVVVEGREGVEEEHRFALQCTANTRYQSTEGEEMVLIGSREEPCQRSPMPVDAAPAAASSDILRNIVRVNGCMGAWVHGCMGAWAAQQRFHRATAMVQIEWQYYITECDAHPYGQVNREITGRVKGGRPREAG